MNHEVSGIGIGDSGRIIIARGDLFVARSYC